MKKKKLRLKKRVKIVLTVLLLLLFASFYQLIKNALVEKENPLVSAEVLNYENIMLKYARENQIEDYLPLLQAMMMQESGGK